jgi:hypothetical protein
LPIVAVDSSIRVAAPADPGGIVAQIGAFLDRGDRGCRRRGC